MVYIKYNSSIAGTNYLVLMPFLLFFPTSIPQQALRNS
uniref:Uncharacterized protein n=1 Tax=Arundo donax TaxID=35708 RepID=A0A0A9AXI0_ARUDO